MTTASVDLEAVNYAVEWIIRLGAIAVVPRHRAPAATGAWLLLIFFLPIVGLLLFLAIGQRRFPAWRTARFQHLLPFFQGTATALTASAPADTEIAGDVAKLAASLGFFPAVGGCAVELIDDYDRVIDRLITDIDAARRHVRILVYIFADDAVGQRVIAALKRAVARGVACQVIIDFFGSKHWRRGTLKLLRQAGVDVCEALPFRILRGRTRRDMRNHRKLFVIDGEIGFAGSQNIVAKDFRPGVTNRELVARVTGAVVAAMEAVIRGDWYLETATEPAAPPQVPAATGSGCVQLLPSGADYRLEGFETLLVWQIHQARERVVIVTPYFVPDEDVLDAMRTAVARGVEVDLVVSAIVDQPLVHLAQCSYYDDLLAAGVRVHLFRDYLLHAKNVSIDDRFAVIGSSNVDLRSFKLNEEVSLLLFDRATVARVAAIQQGYVTASTRLDLAQWRARPALRGIGENLARLVSPLL